jgi:hypothetical protein
LLQIWGIAPKWVNTREDAMPTRKVKGGWKWGKKGKVYKTKKAADRQGRAIRASQRRRRKG